MQTAGAIDRAQSSWASCRSAPDRVSLLELLAWASPFECRTWAIESAGGLGYLPAQQLGARGERVVDVPATLSARVRARLRAGRTRTTRTIPVLSLSPRSARRRSRRSGPKTTPACEHFVEPRDPRRPLRVVGASEFATSVILNEHVVMVLGPIMANEHLPHPHLPQRRLSSSSPRRPAAP